jgi:phenylalanyl-tRNA synthetase beta chain
MHISLAWLNSLLDRPVTAAEAERALTFVGFPIESTTPVAGSTDVVLDVEVTSNRGDCLSHAGVAREVAAATGRVYKPAFAAGDGPSGWPVPTGVAATAALRVENQVAGAAGCPLFSARVIRGVKVGPSPAWLVERLTALGQRPINNVVDATNYVSFELGNPSHVFDLGKIARGADGVPSVIVRGARAGEKLTLLDGKIVELKAGELVVADAERASSLAGIMGGADSAVSGATTDVLLEVATWVPGAVRKAARRLAIRTDASYRFERFVDPRTIAAASDRLVALIEQIAGGRALADRWLVGAALPGSPAIVLRHERVRRMLGIGIDDGRIQAALEAQAMVVERGSPEAWRCTPPAYRPDVRIEQDLIEEIARTIGLDQIPVHEKVAIAVASPQAGERAVRELARVLTGAGFEETVTFSFASEKAVKAFVPAGAGVLSVSDERRKGEGALRPSVLPSLLACRRVNQDHRAAPAGSVRLFELSSIFCERSAGKHEERRVVALLADIPERDPESSSTKLIDRQRAGVRLMRGVIERLIESLHGPAARGAVRVDPVTAAPFAAIDPAASGTVTLDGRGLGWFGLVSAGTLKEYDLAGGGGGVGGVVAAELDLPGLLAGYPPRSLVKGLPQFPAVERDQNIVMDWSRRWAEVEAAVEAALREGALKLVEDYRFVSLFADPKNPAKKRVLVRFIFRDPARTLTGEEVDAQMGVIRERVVPRVGVTLEEFLKPA